MASSHRAFRSPKAADNRSRDLRPALARRHGQTQAPATQPLLRTLARHVRQAVLALAPHRAIAPKAVRFESLEPRLLLAGDLATLAAGALTLNLTSGNDQVTIHQVSSGAQGAIIDITLGAVTQRFGTVDAGVAFAVHAED